MKTTQIFKSSFRLAVFKAAAIEDVFKGDDRGYTVFAPTNEAFEKLDKATQEKVLNGHPCGISE